MAAGSKPKYYLVEASVLPEIFAKVIEAKELLETGQVRTVADAVARVDISRSAFYKYKDFVSPFLDYVEQNNYMQFEAVNEKDLSDRIDAAVALAGRGEEMRRRTELLNRQEDNNRATAARLLGKE